MSQEHTLVVAIRNASQLHTLCVDFVTFAELRVIFDGLPTGALKQLRHLGLTALQNSLACDAPFDDRALIALLQRRIISLELGVAEAGGENAAFCGLLRKIAIRMEELVILPMLQHLKLKLPVFCGLESTVDSLQTSCDFRQARLELDAAYRRRVCDRGSSLGGLRRRITAYSL